jgi:hypothetical protein
MIEMSNDLTILKCRSYVSVGSSRAFEQTETNKQCKIEMCPPKSRLNVSITFSGATNVLQYQLKVNRISNEV